MGNFWQAKNSDDDMLFPSSDYEFVFANDCLELLLLLKPDGVYLVWISVCIGAKLV